MKIGVLASQGAFIEHINTLTKLGVEAIPVRLPRQMAGLDGLIIPGGESTTISKLLDNDGLREAIMERAAEGMPIFGTCAGMIILSKNEPDDRVKPLGLVDITVQRNAFGRQNESFETDLKIAAIGKHPFHCVFIRAPLIEKTGPNVIILAQLKDGTIVAARQKQYLVVSFHPELTEDLRFHQYFLEMIPKKK